MITHIFNTLVQLGLLLLVDAAGAVDVTCSQNVQSICSNLDCQVLVTCPPGCASTGSLWGYLEYTDDSAMCKAAIHSGFSTDASGGTFFAIRKAGHSSYEAKTANGITSNSYGQWGGTFAMAPLITDDNRTGTKRWADFVKHENTKNADNIDTITSVVSLHECITLCIKRNGRCSGINMGHQQDAEGKYVCNLTTTYNVDPLNLPGDADFDFWWYDSPSE